jgi:hypothetical protein
MKRAFWISLCAGSTMLFAATAGVQPPGVPSKPLRQTTAFFQTAFFLIFSLSFFLLTPGVALTILAFNVNIRVHRVQKYFDTIFLEVGVVGPLSNWVAAFFIWVFEFLKGRVYIGTKGKKAGTIKNICFCLALHPKTPKGKVV